MKLSEHNIKTLMISMHDKINEYASFTSENIDAGSIDGTLAYPPGIEFSEEELVKLNKIKSNPVLKNAIKKIIADSSSAVVFDLFNFIDGTTDPSSKNGEWTEIALVDRSEEIKENEEMLHDSLFGTYYDWEEQNS